ncbi:hypothetical protein M406DRAFT_326301 [Cryphonectria parasitica EP155]|uniref:Uncharacterized protein n=1 Tax=Cryphonectria parasitica (strain ATCC 38755 / EP155) TaxID=660469 RepID=A0A9P5CU00_CRYP1|nr:uncharacterized protein M406DRAFT_326301 [Cryphonectria parasitica EP155]KAF3770883.1 hypothetical protein M406DRAFT_326301 [Cryphonectria parasitica EP155]
MAPSTLFLTKDVEALGAEIPSAVDQEKQLLRERDQDQDQNQDQDQAVHRTDRTRQRHRRAMASGRKLLLAVLVCCFMTLGLASAGFRHSRGSCHEEAGDAQHVVVDAQPSRLSSLLSAGEIRELFERFTPGAKGYLAATVTVSSSSEPATSSTAPETTTSAAVQTTPTSTAVETTVQTTTQTETAQATTTTAIPTPSEPTTAASSVFSIFIFFDCLPHFLYHHHLLRLLHRFLFVQCWDDHHCRNIDYHCQGTTLATQTSVPTTAGASSETSATSTSLSSTLVTATFTSTLPNGSLSVVTRTSYSYVGAAGVTGTTTTPGASLQTDGAAQDRLLTPGMAMAGAGFWLLQYL